MTEVQLAAVKFFQCSLLSLTTAENHRSCFRERTPLSAPLQAGRPWHEKSAVCRCGLHGQHRVQQRGRPTRCRNAVSSTSSAAKSPSSRPASSGTCGGAASQRFAIPAKQRGVTGLIYSSDRTLLMFRSSSTPASTVRFLRDSPVVPSHQP